MTKDAKVRDFHGYRQHLIGKKWRFIVMSFDETVTGQDGTCNLMKSDGSRERVPIDKNDRLIVGGMAFNRNHWHH